MKNYYKVLTRGLLLSLLMLLVGCGSMDTGASSNAMSKIKEYANTNGNTTEPTIHDYRSATVIGVDNNDTLSKINKVLREEEIKADDVKEPTNIQMLMYERDILDRYPDAGTSSPTIPAPPPVSPTPPPVSSTPPPVSPTPTPPVSPTPTPPVSPTPVATTPPIESDFKLEDKKGDISLTLKGDGNVTIELGEEYDYENGYNLTEGGPKFDYFAGSKEGTNGETMDINASDYLENKDKVGTYVIYYTLLDKKKKPILKVWRLIEVTSDGKSLNVSTDDYTGDYSTKNGITIKFNFKFPGNRVFLDDKSLTFNDKGFKATKDADGTDVTDKIQLEITFNNDTVPAYDKTKEGTYVFRYTFEGKEIYQYSFTIAKRDEPVVDTTHNPSATQVPTKIPVPLSETVNINDIELKLKYNATFTSGSKSKPIFTEIQWADPGYYFINKKNGKTLHVITMETKQIMGTQYVEETVREADGTTSIKRVPKKVVAGYDTKYGVSYNNKTIKFNEYNKSKGNIGITIVDENGNDVTNYLWQNLSIDDDHNNGSTIGFVVPTDGYIAMPYVLNRKGEMTSQYVFNNYEDEDKYKNKTDSELKDINKVAKTPYTFAIRYIKAIVNTDANTDTNTDTNADTNTDTDANTDTNTDTDANTDTNTDANANADTDTDTDTNTDANADTNV